jgi:hypothetical protein
MLYPAKLSINLKGEIPRKRISQPCIAEDNDTEEEKKKLQT